MVDMPSRCRPGQRVLLVGILKTTGSPGGDGTYRKKTTAKLPFRGLQLSGHSWPSTGTALAQKLGQLPQAYLSQEGPEAPVCPVSYRLTENTVDIRNSVQVF